jgi:hypothetical protein
LGNAPLEVAAYYLNHAVFGGMLHTEHIFSSVEKAADFLPGEVAETVRQETVRILETSSKQMNNLSGADGRTLQTLRTNADLKILSADKGNSFRLLEGKKYFAFCTQQKMSSMRNKHPWEHHTLQTFTQG